MYVLEDGGEEMQFLYTIQGEQRDDWIKVGVI